MEQIRNTRKKKGLNLDDAMPIEFLFEMSIRSTRTYRIPCYFLLNSKSVRLS